MSEPFVWCVAEYANGSEARFRVAEADLANGDHIAILIAQELARNGGLPPGKIIRIARAKPDKKRAEG